MMFGTREPFRYLECGACASLMIAELPRDLERHYPPGYYSHGEALFRERDGVRRWLKRRRARHNSGRRDLAGGLVLALLGPAWHQRGLAGVPLDARILDVGCGRGQLLVTMAEEGFIDLTGVDPFIESDIEHPEGIRILRSELGRVRGAWDLIMLHHSLEHVPDPLGTLRDARERLRPRGRVLVRLPVADCAAWREYGMDWVQLDPPRHLHVPSLRGMGVLADGAGLRIVRVEHDSDELQFWGSEQYRRDIPLHDARSWLVDRARSPFRAADMRAFRRRARALNRKGEGDQACFLLEAKA